jgi:hypothetical protein
MIEILDHLDGAQLVRDTFVSSAAHELQSNRIAGIVFGFPNFAEAANATQPA